MAEQGETWSGFLEAELKQEDARRATLDARGLALTTTSSGLVSLVFALTVVVTGGKDYAVDGVAALFLVLALVAFVAAAVLGLLANRGREYEVADGPTLQAMLTTHWTDDEVDARNVVADLRRRMIVSLRAGNNDKARYVTVGLGCQIVAIGLLVVAVLADLSSRWN